MANDKRVKWYDRQRVDSGDMTREQDYLSLRVANIFNRALGNGIISGLQVSDDSEIVSQTVQESFYDTFIDTVGNRIYQVFKATANNLQQVVIRGQNIGAGGNVSVSIHALLVPTNSLSNIITTPIGTKTLAVGSFPVPAHGEVTFDFTGVSALTQPGSLVVDHYYAISIVRDSNVGSIDIYYTTTNPYTDGHIREYVTATGLYTSRDTWDLYFKVLTDAVQISAGYAYHDGNPIEVSSAIRKINLTDTTGATNYIYIKYKEVQTDLETHPRTGLQVYSRIQDYYEVTLYTSEASAGSDEEILGQTVHGTIPLVITDRRIFVPGRNSIWDAYINYSIVLTGESIQAGLSVKDCVYYNTTNSQWEKASASNLPQGILTGSGEITLSGKKTGLTGLTAGSWYYMDIDGDLTTDKTGIQMGFAISTTVLLIMVSFNSDSLLINGTTNANALDCVYYNTTNAQWETASFTNLPQGILISVDGTNGEILLSGRVIDNTAPFTAGSWYYMSAAGLLVTTLTQVRIGYAISTSVLLMNINIDGTSNKLYGQTVNNALSVKDCVYFTGGQWEKASNTNLPQGILTDKNGTIGEITLSGLKTGFAAASFTTNTWYYMDSSGNLTTAVTNTKIGYAISTTSLLIDIDFILSNPVGTVISMPVASTSPPTGYLFCDGSSLLRTTYADLFSIIGTAHGNADATHFNIPDYRGRFLRGQDVATTRDPDAATRTAMNLNGNTGDNVGSIQADEFKSHTHTGNVVTTGWPNGWVGTAGTSYYASGIGSTGGNETRPINAYTNFFIKY